MRFTKIRAEFRQTCGVNRKLEGAFDKKLFGCFIAHFANCLPNSVSDVKPIIHALPLHAIISNLHQFILITIMAHQQPTEPSISPKPYTVDDDGLPHGHRRPHRFDWLHSSCASLVVNILTRFLLRPLVVTPPPLAHKPTPSHPSIKLSDSQSRQ